ncbi:MAG TPA: hypothetical protein VLF66_06220, partial [Thermoanaerobaculia bacterium]|nr:hypothetical protein [Thermoanaerobaculia bacterium]
MNHDGGNLQSRRLWGLRIAVLLVILGAVGLAFATRELRSSPDSLAAAPTRLQGFGYALDALTG